MTHKLPGKLKMVVKVAEDTESGILPVRLFEPILRIWSKGQVPTSGMDCAILLPCVCVCGGGGGGQCVCATRAESARAKPHLQV